VTITHQAKCDKPGWADVIRDAETEIALMKKRTSQLKAAIRIFKQKMASGDALPAGLKAIE
jgi:hypothetical protein